MKHRTEQLYPLTLGQKDVFLPTLLLPKAAREMNSIGLYFTVKDEQRVPHLEQAFNYLLQENETLRQRCVWTGKGLRQYVAPYEPVQIPVEAVSTKEQLQQRMEQNCFVKGILRGKPLVQPTIFLCEGEATLRLIIHHLCFDGYSMGLLLTRFQAYMEQLAAGEPVQVPVRKYTLEDFWKEKAEANTAEARKAERKYWRSKIQNLEDFRIVTPHFQCKSEARFYRVPLSKDLYSRVGELSKETHVPAPFLVTCATALAMSKEKGHKDVALYQILHGRSMYVQKQLMGSLLQTVLNFYHVEPEQTVSQYATASYLEYLDCIKHGNITAIERILAALPSELKTMRFNYYGLIFTTLNIPEQKDDGLYEYGAMPYHHQPNQLYCSIGEHGDGTAEVTVSYQSKAISRERLEAFAQKTISLLDTMTTSAGEQLGTLL